MPTLNKIPNIPTPSQTTPPTTPVLPTKNRAFSCTALSILAFIGLIAGFYYMSAITLIVFLVPTVVYEIFILKEKSEKFKSLGILSILILEIILLILNITFSLSTFLSRSTEYVQGYSVPLGDVKIAGPAIIIILSIILFRKSQDIYTKWMSSTVIVSSLAMTYLLDPTTFTAFAKIGFEKLLTLI